MTKDEALAMIQRHINWTDKHPTDYMKAKIEAAIALAQPEIVHCSECKFYDPDGGYCDGLELFLSSDFYCKFAKKGPYERRSRCEG